MNRFFPAARALTKQLLRLVALAAVAVSVGADSCSDPAPSADTPAFSMSISGLSDNVVQGTSTTFTVTVNRTGGFTGAVNIAGQTDRAGGPTITPTTIPSDQSSGIVTMTSTADTPLGNYSLELGGSGTGVGNQEVIGVFRLVAAGTFSLDLGAGDIAGNPGTTYHATLQLTRNAYTDAVTLSATPVAGFTTTISPTTVTGTSADISIAVGSSVALGDYTLPIIGTGADGIQKHTLNFPLRVRLPQFLLNSAAPPNPIAIGTSGTAAITAVRDAGVTGAINLTATGAAGITIAPATVAVGATQASMTISVANTVTPGSYLISVTGTTAGAANQTTSFNVVVGGFGLNVVTAPLPVAAGASQPDVVQFNRSNFTDAITVAATSDPGITITASPSPTTAAQTTLTVTVGSTVSNGTHTVNLQGTSGASAISTTFAVVVSSTATNTTWTFCPATGLPVWVAVQDGTAPWIQVTGSNNAYPFNIGSGRGGIAYVISANGVNQLHVFYGSQSELQTQGAGLCTSSAATKTVSSAVSNTGTAATAFASLGSAFKFIPLPATTFQWTSVPPGALDLVASTVDGASPPNAIRMLMRRNVNAADQSTIASLDLGASGPEAFTPAVALYSLVNSLGQQVNLTGQLHTSNNFLSTYYIDASSSVQNFRNIFGLPAANQAAGDLHYWSAVANSSGSGTVPVRTAGLVFASVAPAKTFAFGSALNTPVPSKLSGVVERMALGVQAEYNKLWQVDYDQSSSAGRSASVQMTAAYQAGGGTANIDLPDLSTVSGWLAAYGLQTGTPANFRVTASSWSTPAGITFVQLVDGATFTSASVPGTITP